MNNLSIFGDVASPIFEPSSVEVVDGVAIMSEIFSNIISIAGVVLVIIGTWKILEKAGEKGWKALIPFYNSYILFKIFWQKKWFWFSLVSEILTIISTIFIVLAFSAMILLSGVAGATVGIGTIISAFSGSPEVMQSWADSASEFSMGSHIGASLIAILVAFLIQGICVAFDFVLKIILKVKIAKAFGKSGGFAVGLILLAPIFYMILGLGKDQYIKEKEQS